MKKLLSFLFILLSLVCVFSLVSCNFFEPTDDIVKDSSGLEYIYIENEDAYALHGIGTCTDTEIEVAETVNGKPVTHIGDYAFNDCTSLTSIEIPDSITSIGNRAFGDCESLTSIEIPDSVISIGDRAFVACNSLTSVKISDSLTSIGDDVFSSCLSLTSVEIPDSVTSIGQNAFASCRSLTSVVVPDSVTSIGLYAFSDCSSLEDVYYTGDIESWMNIEFKNSFSNPLSWGANLYFDNELVTEIVISDPTTVVKDYAFYGCKSLKSVVISNPVSGIRPYAFAGCTSLKSVVIGSSVVAIYQYAFRNCTSLTIYCEAESEPAAWIRDWNPQDRPIVWGYTGE